MAKKVAKKKVSRRKAVAEAAGERPRLPVPEPIALDNLHGQERALGLIRAVLSSGRVHHAWLFHGPRGVGKFTAALALAAVLLDSEAVPDLSGQIIIDPESAVQRLLRGGGHPDLHIIRKELAVFSRKDSVRTSKQRSLPIEVVREFLIEPAERSSAMPGGLARKVFIVDEAELLASGQGEAQNALLKTLEEPPPGTVLILVTSSEDRLLPTIRSRCQRVAFTPLEEGAMRAWLDGSGLGVGGAERDWLLAYAGGSPGALSSAHDSGMHAWWSELAPMLDMAASGREHPALGPRMAELVDTWASEWVKRGAKGIEHRSKEAANRDGARRMLALVGHHARGCLADPARRAWGVRAIELIGDADDRSSRSVQAGFVFASLAAGLAAPVGELVP